MEQIRLELLICIILQIRTNVNALQNSQLHPPYINVDQVILQDEYVFQNVSDIDGFDLFETTSRDVILGQDIRGISIKCSAEYPVYWDTDEELLELKQAMYSSWIDPTTFTARDVQNNLYTATLQFWSTPSTISGFYYCRSAKKRNLYAKKYIFAEVFSQTFLLHAGKTVSVPINGKDQIVLPCRIVVPDSEDVSPKLFKQFNATDLDIFKELLLTPWERIRTNDSITYDPRIGYTFNVSRIPDILGHYKCSADDDNVNDVMFFHVIKESSTDPQQGRFRSFLQGTAEVSVNRNSTDWWDNKVTCCSDGTKPPKLNLAFCMNEAECNIAKSKFTLDIKRGMSYNEIDKNCVSASTYGLPFLLQCMGDGVDVLQEYAFYFRNSSVTGFQDLNQNRIYYAVGSESRPAETNQLITIAVEKSYSSAYQEDYDAYDSSKRNSESGIYSGQFLTVICYISSFHLTSGGNFMLKLKDGSEEILDGERPLSDIMDYIEIRIMANTSMESISCRVPLFNSTELATISEALNVSAAFIPSLIGGSEIREITWTVNDTDRTLECEFDGTPIPSVTWARNGKIMQFDEEETFESQLYRVNQTGRKSILEFTHKIDHHDSVLFACTGHNFVGSATISFNVTIEDLPTWHTTTILLIVTLHLLVFSLTFSYFLRRYLQTRKQLNELRSVT